MRAYISHAQPDDPATDGLVCFPVCTLAFFGAEMDRVARTADFAGVLQTACAHGTRAYTELHSAQSTIGRFGRFIVACIATIAPNLRKVQLSMRAMHVDVHFDGVVVAVGVTPRVYWQSE